MKVKEILSRKVIEGNVGPEDDFSIEGPFDMSNGPAPEQEEDSTDDEEEFGLCGQCSGSGEGMYDGSVCRVCKGSGVIDNREQEDPDDQRDRQQDARFDGSSPDHGGWDD